MKIKRGRLQQIDPRRAQESSQRLEYNPDYDKVFMVVAQAYGKIELLAEYA